MMTVEEVSGHGAWKIKTGSRYKHQETVLHGHEAIPSTRLQVELHGLDEPEDYEADELRRLTSIDPIDANTARIRTGNAIMLVLSGR